MWHDGAAMARLALAAHDTCGFEDLNVFMVWTHLEAMGAVVNFNKPIPFLEKPLFKLGDQYQMPDMDQYVKHPSVSRTIAAFKKARQLAGKDVAVTMVTSWGPLTTAGHLVGTEALMYGIATEPDEVRRLLKFVAEYNAEAYKAELAPGLIDDADAVTPGEPTASGDLISSEMFEEFSLPYLQTEFKAMKSTGAPAALHICGDTSDHLPLMALSGAKALSIEQKVDPYLAVKQVKGKAALIGNVGPIEPLMLGTPEQVRKDTLRCIDAGFNVIHPGCALPPETPTANLRAMTEATKGFRRPL
jgi:MtaA/CmuA family methyltransferase